MTVTSPVRMTRSPSSSPTQYLNYHQLINNMVLNNSNSTTTGHSTLSNIYGMRPFSPPNHHLSHQQTTPSPTTTGHHHHQQQHASSRFGIQQLLGLSSSGNSPSRTSSS